MRGTGSGPTATLVLALAGLTGACGSADEAPTSAGSRVQVGTTVTIETGPLVGVEQGPLRVFRGIPYAAAPVGARRFAEPEPPAAWSQPRAADMFGPGCPQNDTNPLNRVSETSEDCLTLNVWAHRDETLRPVMVWLHGGGFVTGSGSSVLYEGSQLASRGEVVVVTLNYRLGALGFLTTEALRDASPDSAVGNLGLRDQGEALRWLQRNIEIFGGDPHNITLFGESAGAVSVCHHLGISSSSSLFHRAIIQSGGGCDGAMMLDSGWPDDGGALELGRIFMQASPCAGSKDPLGCLRSLSVTEVLATQAALPNNELGLNALAPVIDGVTLEGTGATRFGRDTPDRPLVIGSNYDEMELFLFGGKVSVNSEAEYRAAISPRSPGEAATDAALELYSISAYGSPRAAFSQMMSDLVFACPAQRFALASASGTEPSYAYDFRGGLGGLATGLGAAHGLEIPFVFGNLDDSSLWDADDDDQVLSERMLPIWASFAWQGRPDASPTWEAHDERGLSYVFEESGDRAEVRVRGTRCEELTELGFLPR